MFYTFTEDRLVDYMEMFVSSLERLAGCGQMCRISSVKGWLSLRFSISSLQSHEVAVSRPTFLSHIQLNMTNSRITSAKL